ncbi:MAG: hypothetical protein K2N06_06185 [Oscillospiraceae bacterium]|nr:hypothetical protein [Oscillospiraceae bacterium]
MSKRAEKSAGAPTEKMKNKSHKAIKKSVKSDKSPKAAAQKPGNKTPQVMRLVERDKRGKGANLVLMAGKSRVPKSLRGKEPLSGFAAGEFEDSADTIVVNITELAINYEAPLILDRFNACSCDKCVEVFSMRIAERVPVRFARVNRAAQYCSLAERNELSERVDPMRKIVLAEMTRELIGNKKRCFHDEKE